MVDLELVNSAQVRIKEMQDPLVTEKVVDLQTKRLFSFQLWKEEKGNMSVHMCILLG